jgi:hypothetical protein
MTIPFTTLMLVLAVVAVKWGPVKLSHLLLGMAVGLSLSGTVVGDLVQEMATTLTAATIDAVSGVATIGPALGLIAGGGA